MTALQYLAQINGVPSVRFEYGFETEGSSRWWEVIYEGDPERKESVPFLHFLSADTDPEVLARSVLHSLSGRLRDSQATDKQAEEIETFLLPARMTAFEALGAYLDWLRFSRPLPSHFLFLPEQGDKPSGWMASWCEGRWEHTLWYPCSDASLSLEELAFQFLHSLRQQLASVVSDFEKYSQFTSDENDWLRHSALQYHAERRRHDKIVTLLARLTPS